MQQRLSQVADEIQFAALHAELQSVKRRLQDVEKAAADAAPLDGLQCGAVEARLAILEEDYAVRHVDVDDVAGDAQPVSHQREVRQLTCVLQWNSCGGCMNHMQCTMRTWMMQQGTRNLSGNSARCAS
jgi:hypothetical protein